MATSPVCRLLPVHTLLSAGRGVLSTRDRSRGSYTAMVRTCFRSEPASSSEPAKQYIRSIESISAAQASSCSGPAWLSSASPAIWCDTRTLSRDRSYAPIQPMVRRNSGKRALSPRPSHRELAANPAPLRSLARRSVSRL